MTSGVVPYTNKDSTGLVTDKDRSVSATQFDVNAVWTQPGMKFAAEFSSLDQTCDKTALAGTSATAGTTYVPLGNCKDQINTAYILGTRIVAGPGEIQAHYANRGVTNSYTGAVPSGSVVATPKVDFAQNINEIMLGYQFTISSNFVIVPVYIDRQTTATQKVAGVKVQERDQDQSFIALGGRAVF
jgi:hypothetical protein